MATGGGTSIKDSDICYDFPCTVCEEKGRNVEAIKRCEDCRENMCGDCLDNHNMFKAMREHSLLDKQEVGKSGRDGGRPDLPSVRCGSHPGNRVELYCGNHDDVGCATCGNIDHKLCKDMHYIPDVAAGIKTTSEPRDVADSLSTLIKRTARAKQVREEDLRRVTTERDTAVQSIEQRVESIKQRLDDLKLTAIAEVDMTFGDLEQTITHDIDRAQDVINKLEKEERRLKAAQNATESDLFVYAKQGRAGVREGEKVVQELEKSRGEFLHFVVDDTVLACITELDKFVKVCGPVGLSLSVEQIPNVRMADDQKKCSITDCCILDNGDMLLTDEKNKCLKLFDKSYRALDRYVVRDCPGAVCVIGTGEVAMSLYNDKVVQFAGIDEKICLTRSFSVSEYCRGMVYSNNRLVINCGGMSDRQEGTCQVRIYDTNGDLLQTITHDDMDVPFHAIATRNDGCIIANGNRGILAFDNSGISVWQFQHADLKFATGLCEVDNWVLVCCLQNGHVFQVNPADRSSRILLRGSTELENPTSLTYDVCNDKIVVTKNECDHLLVYKISRK